jgi:hypothetical protein
VTTGRVGWLRFNDKPYMTAPERGEFKRLRDGGAVTVFGVQICAADGCENEVPRDVKLYCSQACWQKEEGRTDEKEEEASGSMD